MEKIKNLWWWLVKYIFAPIIRASIPGIAIKHLAVSRPQCEKFKSAWFAPSAKRAIRWLKKHPGVTKEFLSLRSWRPETVSFLFGDPSTVYNQDGSRGYCPNLSALATQAKESDLKKMIDWAPFAVTCDALEKKTPSNRWMVDTLKEKEIVLYILKERGYIFNGLSLGQLITLLPDEVDEVDKYLAEAITQNPNKWAIPVMKAIVMIGGTGGNNYPKAYEAAFNAAFNNEVSVSLVEFIEWLANNDETKFRHMLINYDRLNNKESYLVEIIKVVSKDDFKNDEGVIAVVDSILSSEAWSAYKRDKEKGYLNEAAQEIQKNWASLCGKKMSNLFCFCKEYSNNFEFLFKIAETAADHVEVERIILKRGYLLPYFPFKNWEGKNQLAAIQELIDKDSFPIERMGELDGEHQTFARKRLLVRAEIKVISGDKYYLQKAVDDGIIFCPEVEGVYVCWDKDSGSDSTVNKYISKNKMSLEAFKCLTKKCLEYNMGPGRVQAHIDKWGLDDGYLEALQASPYYSYLAGRYTAKQRATSKKADKQ